MLNQAQPEVLIKGSIDEMNAEGRQVAAIPPVTVHFTMWVILTCRGSRFDGVPDTPAWVRDEGPPYGTQNRDCTTAFCLLRGN